MRYLMMLQLALVVCLPILALGDCPKLRIRKEIKDLTVDEAHLFIKGMRTLYANGAAKPLIDMHIRTLEDAHTCPQFLPYHRYMIWNMENELLKVVPELKGLPYWDATYDVDNPLAAFPFRDDMMGTATPGGSACLEGPFTGTEHDGCVTRKASVGNRWFSNDLLKEHTFSSETYDDFNTKLIDGQHNQVHNYFPNSTFGTLDISPADPIFWLHHGAIDYYWAKWQGMDNNGENKFKYGGMFAKGPRKGTIVTKDDIIENYSVSALLNYDNELCYQYEEPKNAVNGNQDPFKFGEMKSTAPDGMPDKSTNSTSDNLANKAKIVTNLVTNALTRMPTRLGEDFARNWNINQTLLDQFDVGLQSTVDSMNNRSVNALNVIVAAPQELGSIDPVDTKRVSASDSGTEIIFIPSFGATAVIAMAVLGLMAIFI